MEADLHHRRRVALNPYFSKRQIGSITPLFKQCATKLCDRLLGEYKGTDKVVTMNEAYAAFGSDVIFQYCFGWSNNYLDYPDFIAPLTTAFRQTAVTAHVAGHFPWFRKLMQSLPQKFVGVMNPALIPIFENQNVGASNIPLSFVADSLIPRKSSHT